MEKHSEVKKGSYSLLPIMTALALLALSLSGAARADVCSPGVSPFLEVDGNLGFNSFAGASVDWAKSGANPSGCLTSANQTAPIMCSGTGGLFDGGAFVNSTTPPIAPAYVGTDPSIVAAAFGVDQLSVDVSKHCRFTVDQPCVTDSDCPGGATDTCILCTGDPTVYTGTGGETNGDLLNSETYGKGNSTPNKDDISNVYAVARQIPINPDTSTCTDCSNPAPSCGFKSELYAGFERVVNNGDSHVDLEFLQQPVSLVQDNKTDQCAGHFLGHRTEGDLLLSVDFTTGGTLGTNALHSWVCGSCPRDPVTRICDPCKVSGRQVPAHYEPLTGPDVIAQPGHCSDDPRIACTQADVSQCAHPTTATCLLVRDAIKQSVNSGGAVGCGGWACRNANGTGPVATLATNEVYEVGIALTGIGFTGCLSTFLPHTRSSQSFTATLKDFKVISFNTCVPATCLTKSASASTTVTYTFTEQNDGNVPLKPPSCTGTTCSATDRSSVVTDSNCDGTSLTYTSGDGNSNNLLDPGEVWSFTCTKTVTIGGSGTATVRNRAISHGKDSLGRDVTACAGHCSATTSTVCFLDSDCLRGETCTLQPPSSGTVCDQRETDVTTVSVTVTGSGKTCP